jgi:DNA-binding IclR family transcriptional regulator
VLLAVVTEPAGISDVARRVELPVSTVARLLATLENLGAVVRQDDGVTYRIGPTVNTLAAGNDTALIHRARPFLIELVEHVGETAGISVLAGDEVLYLDHVETDRSVQLRDWTGARSPLHVVSSGLVFLAHQPAERVEGYAAGRLVAPTEHSIRSPGQLARRLEAVRDDGFAWTADELEVGITSVSAPVRNRAGEVIAAIHCHGPSYRFPAGRDRSAIESAVAAAARRLSATNLD